MDYYEKATNAQNAFILMMLSWRYNPRILGATLDHDECNMGLYDDIYDHMEHMVTNLIPRIKTETTYRKIYHMAYDENFQKTLLDLDYLMLSYRKPKQATKKTSFKDDIVEYVLRNRFLTACENNELMDDNLLEEMTQDIYDRFYTLLAKNKIDVKAEENTVKWNWDKLRRIAAYNTTARTTYEALQPIIDALHKYAQTTSNMHDILRYKIDPHSGATEAYMLEYLSEVASFDDFIIFTYGAFCQRYDNSRSKNYIPGLRVFEITQEAYSKFIEKFQWPYPNGTSDPFTDKTMQFLNLQKLSTNPDEQLTALLDKLLSDMLLTIYAYHVPILKDLNIL